MASMITLNEAVNIIMGDSPRSPAQEIGRLVKYQNLLYQLAMQHKVEFARLDEDLKRKVFKDSLVPSPRVKSPPVPVPWPPDEFVDPLGPRDPEWPPCLLELYDAASKISLEMSQYDQSYASALSRLLQAGRRGNSRSMDDCPKSRRRFPSLSTTFYPT